MKHLEMKAQSVVSQPNLLVTLLHKYFAILEHKYKLKMKHRKGTFTAFGSYELMC